MTHNISGITKAIDVKVYIKIDLIFFKSLGYIRVVTPILYQRKEIDAEGQKVSQLLPRSLRL